MTASYTQRSIVSHFPLVTVFCRCCRHEFIGLLLAGTEAAAAGFKDVERLVAEEGTLVSS